VVVVSLAVFAVAPVAVVWAGSRSPVPPATPAVLDSGMKVYRQFCGQCHSLKEAKAVGFGSATANGVGENGGPSFNLLKVSYQMCLASVTELFGGHDRVVKKMTWQQLKDVSTFVQWATRTHPIVAKVSDG
jgi:hypothetical protein